MHSRVPPFIALILQKSGKAYEPCKTPKASLEPGVAGILPFMLSPGSLPNPLWTQIQGEPNTPLNK